MEEKGEKGKKKKTAKAVFKDVWFKTSRQGLQRQLGKRQRKRRSRCRYQRLQQLFHQEE